MGKQVLNAFDIEDGYDDLFAFDPHEAVVQPLQMIPAELKTDKWFIQNADYWEFEGLRQIEEKSKRFLKLFDLAAGVLNKEDYMDLGADLEQYEDIYEMMVSEENPLPEALQMQFYPLIPSYFQTLSNEYKLRGTSKVEFRATDQNSVNEILDAKQQEVESVLLKYAQGEMLKKLIDAGVPMDDPSIQEKMTVPNIRQELPEIDMYYSRKYRTKFEIWANKMHSIDRHRFYMDSLERESFNDYLTVDSTYWYINMKEDDYSVEHLNPVLTFAVTSPKSPWVSEGVMAGYFEMVSVADIIDEDGDQLDEEQMRNLESLLPANVDATYRNADLTTVASKYNPTLTKEQNNQYGRDLRNLMATASLGNAAYDIVDYIIGKGSQKELIHNTGLLRRTTLFWKGQRKIGLVYEIDKSGKASNYKVDETFVPQTTNVYNTKFQNLRSAETLVYGQHVDWTWVNEIYGVRKISGSHATFTSLNDEADPTAIYIGVGSKKPGPLKFQFKGRLSRWGARLPIEGRKFNSRNTYGVSMVESLIPAQIIHNIANNQIVDIMADEDGPILQYDQNTIPQNSFDGSWGKHNYAKSRAVMKEFGTLVTDSSMYNTESAMAMTAPRVLDLSQNSRLSSRISLAQYSKQLANDTLGFSPQRIAQQNGSTSQAPLTATEVEQTQAGSYNRTETYFIDHADELMPRVHELRTMAAQYYMAGKKSFVLENIISPEERALFEINGTDLMARDIQVYPENSSKRRKIMENILNWVSRNNTNGASITDVPLLMQTESLSEMNDKLNQINARIEKQAELQHQREMEKIQEQAKLEEAAANKAYNREAYRDLLERQHEILKEQIRASGYAASQDLNKNNQSDQIDLIDMAKKESQFNDRLEHDKQVNRDNVRLAEKKLEIEDKKAEAQIIKSNNELSVAAVNRNRYDKGSNK